MNSMPALTGPAMKHYLSALGIPVQRVTRKRKTGEYVADFFVPPAIDEPISGKHAVLPPQIYVDMLREKVPDARITGAGEWKTDWRDDPVDHVRYEAFITFIVPETFTEAVYRTEQQAKQTA
jgi:hypothetical protein